MATEAAMVNALNKAAASVGRPSLQRADHAALCDEYKKIRKWIVLALPLIKKIPVIGGKIAAVLQFLMMIADTCRGSKSR